MITKEQAVSAGMNGHVEFHFGQCKTIIGSRGGQTFKIETWRANGACKTWATRQDEFSLPIKYGFKGPYSYITQSNAADFHIAADCTPRETNPNGSPYVRKDVLGKIEASNAIGQLNRESEQ